MSSLSREIVFLILQYLDEENYKESIHKLEKESGFFFNMRYFEDAVSNGDWDEVENYLSGFTKVEDNRHSMKIFFEIRKQRYLEALDRHDYAKAREILVKDLKVFSTSDEELFKEITMLLTLNNFRENEQLSKYVDSKAGRALLLVELERLIKANPLIRDKLQFPTLKNSRLRTLINQSCGQANGATAPSPATNPLAGSMAKVGGFPPLGVHGVFQPAPAGFTAPLAGWMANPSSVPHQTVSAGLMRSSGVSLVKRPRTSTDNPAIDYQTAGSDILLKGPRLFGISDEVKNMPVNILPVTYPGQSQTQTLYSPDDLPKTVVAKLHQGSAITSLDFHPLQHSLLLVGTNIGDVSVWDVGSKERLVHRNFYVWELSARTESLQASLKGDYAAEVNRVIWSPDGALFGVAYSKHIVHLYAYQGGTELRDHLEIDAHVGFVNDLAFTHLNKQLCIVTCGEDKTIKVWDAASGSKLFTFEGHEAPVYSLCPHQKENIQFIFSTAIDGKIKAWLYDNMGSRVDYDAPGYSCTSMAYTADGTRLFSCGTNKEGESFMVEWNESEGAVKQSYVGLGKRSIGVVQFDTMQNKFLAAGDEFVIKIWDMDDTNLLTTINAEGGLPASPCIRFNKADNLLAVSTSDKGIKIVANADGVKTLRSIESRIIDSSRVASGSAVKDPSIGGFPTSIPTVGTNNGAAERNIPLLPEINEQSQLRSMRLPDHMLPVRIMRLMYTNSGGALLALAYNAVHKLWKWQRNEPDNVAGVATASISPQLWTPTSGFLMTNEIGEANPEEAVPCFALSKNDSYVMSASGGKISLFNMMTFKTMTTVMSPPPAATSLAFHPVDNNVIAIGMDDSTIVIYNVQVDEVKGELEGHHERVTGLAFSCTLNVLVSSGADSQLCVWNTNEWEKRSSKFLQMPKGRSLNSLAHTRVQFHQDQIHVMAIHETQIAIYEAPNLEGLKQWFPPLELSGAITDATYSCDSQSIYVSFENGSIGVLVSATLTLRCMINPASYLSSVLSNQVYPVALAAHPSQPNQFALGLTDGGVHVLEPLESEGKWGTPPPAENKAGPTISSDQPSSR